MAADDGDLDNDLKGCEADVDHLCGDVGGFMVVFMGNNLEGRELAESDRGRA